MEQELLKEFRKLRDDRTGEGFSKGIKLNGEQVWDWKKIEKFLLSALSQHKEACRDAKITADAKERKKKYYERQNTI